MWLVRLIGANVVIIELFTKIIYPHFAIFTIETQSHLKALSFECQRFGESGVAVLFKACPEFAAQAVAGFHKHQRSAPGRFFQFDCRLDGSDAALAVKLVGEPVGHIAAVGKARTLRRQ